LFRIMEQIYFLLIYGADECCMDTKVVLTESDPE